MRQVQDIFAKSISHCMFYIILMLSFALSLTDTIDDEHSNKALPISILIANIIIILLLLLNILPNFGGFLNGSNPSMLILFIIVLILSFILSIVDVSDSEKENKSLPVITLVVNSLIILYTSFQAINPGKSVV